MEQETNNTPGHVENNDQATGGTSDGQSPPWGDAANFDPEKAWNLIQNLRKEKGIPVEEFEKERKAREALEEKFSKLGEALGVSQPDEGKTDVEQLTERLTAFEQQLSQERLARWRAEIAHEKGLTPAQAERLRGETREELAADADELLSLFPSAGESQKRFEGGADGGPRGSQKVDLDGQIREAEASGDKELAIRLKTAKLFEAKKP